MFGWNALSSYARYTVSFLVAFFLVPIMLNTLGPEQFGLFSLVFSILSVVGMLDMGFAAALVKYVAQYQARGDIEGRNRLASSLLLVYTGLAFLALGIISLLSFSMSALLSIPEAQLPTAQALLWILSLRAVILLLPLSLFRGVLFGLRHVVSLNIVSVAGNLLYGLGAMWALGAGYGIKSVAIASLLSMLVEHGVYILLTWRLVPDLRLSWSLVDRSLLGRVTNFSWHQFVCDGAALILLHLDLLLVQALGSLSQVAFYAIALRLSTQAHFFCKQYINTLSPIFADLGARGDRVSIRSVFIQSSDLALAPALILFIGIALLGQPFLGLWVGEQYSSAWPLLLVLMGAVTLGVPRGMAANLLANTGAHKVVSYASLLSILANVFFSLFLYSHYGLLGVALGSLCAVLLIEYPLIVWRSCRSYDLSFLGYLSSLLRGHLPPCALMIGAINLCSAYLNLDSLPGILMVGAIGATIYALVFWRMRSRRRQKLLVEG